MSTPGQDQESKARPGVTSVSKMGIREFGEALISTQDLDPVYCAIWGAKLERDQLCRLLLAYWCFYHLGVAAFISEFRAGEYWALMTEAAENDQTKFTNLSATRPSDRWPRAAERRHFRGQKCVKAVDDLSCIPVEQRFRNLVATVGVHPLTDKMVMERVQRWPLFGPWIAFKAADMLERVMGVPVQFDRDLGLMYEEPRKGLELLRERNNGFQSLEFWYSGLIDHFSQLKAPPAHDRPCGPQEVETILCKWKSHMNGHYTVGKDIREVRHALVGWGSTAERMLATCPPEVIQ